MEPTTQAVPGYFVWEVPGQPVVIHLHFDVVDRLAADIVRGYAAVPKRGAEVGGVLLGSIETGAVTTVRVKDFETVPCQHQRGPSYLFTENERDAFDQLCAQWQPGEARSVYAVGYYRSHTREGPLLTPEDVELLDRCFPFPSQVALLVKPFATKASLAAFFVRENGQFPDTARLEFPLRRDELTRGLPGEEPSSQPSSEPPEKPVGFPYVDRRRRRPGLPGWVWIPLSFVFLMLGLLLGYQAALTKASSAQGDAPFSLALSVTRTGDNLTVRWNRDAPTIRAAQKGSLEIEDGKYSKPVDLDVAHLQGGSLIYRNSSDHVRFRLIVSLNARSSVTETLEWRQ